MSRPPGLSIIRLCCLFVFTACLPSSLSAAGPQAAPSTPNAQMEPGAKVYAAQKCSICHSIAGVGNKKLPLDSVGAKLSVDQIREWIVTPVEAAKKANSTVKPPMRAYPKLPKADLDALVSYIKNLNAK